MSRKPRFWRWYRTLPLLAMLAVAVLSFGMGNLPARLMRRYVFPVSYEQQILESSGRHGVDPLLTCAIISCESGWDANVVSDAGAVGLMQMMGETSADLAAYGVVDSYSYDPSNLTDPTTNIEYGCAYLGQLQMRLGSTEEVVAAYNAGPGSVEQWLSGGGELTDVINFPETASYLVRVVESYKQYQSLYTQELTPIDEA